MKDGPGPLLTAKVHQALLAARDSGTAIVECSLDLERSAATIEVDGSGWSWGGLHFPFLDDCKDRTIYHWAGKEFRPVARFTTSLIKLIPTHWGPPTFEIDGIKMLPTAQVSPYADAEHKVGLIQPRGKEILDTCGGLGYFAAQCLDGRAARVQSFEKNPDVIWLRSLNPWSPDSPWSREDRAALTLAQADVAVRIAELPSESFDAILHDPPRFAIAGDLYSQTFYNQLARVLRRRGKLFHYTGAPNSLSRSRDLPGEVAARLHQAGFAAKPHGDGILAVRR